MSQDEHRNDAGHVSSNGEREREREREELFVGGVGNSDSDE